MAAASNVHALPLRPRSRSRKAPLPFLPQQVWIDREVAGNPQVIRIRDRLEEFDVDVDIADDVRTLKHPQDLSVAKTHLVLTAQRGRVFKPCQGIGTGHLCCNYRVLDLVSGCPMDCSYCILQSYLANNPVTTAYVNLEEILAQVSSFLDANSNRFFRIGTGELADSLALDPILDFASVLVPFFASTRNALFELKTKSTFVDHLLDLTHRNRTVVSWSLNTPEIIASDERQTSTLDERLAAAHKVAQAGYGVGFHFDPIIVTHADEAEIDAYLGVIDKIFEVIEPDQIAWISLGLLRYPPDLPRIAMRRFPQTRIFTGELVPSGNKMRYARFIRQKVYKPLWEKLRQHLPERKVYLCMETEAVWNRIDATVTKNACIEGRLCNTAILREQ